MFVFKAVLNAEFPSVIVPNALRLEVTNLAVNNVKPVSSAILFRMLICTILNDDQVWIDLKAKQILNQYPDEVNSCQGIIS